MYPKEEWTEIVNMQPFLFLFLPFDFLPKIFEDNNSRVQEGTENGATERQQRYKKGETREWLADRSGEEKGRERTLDRRRVVGLTAETVRVMTI